MADAMTDQCPLGGPRCHEAICDCFIDQYPADPLGLHPEAYVVGTSKPEPVAHDLRCISLTDSEFNDHCDCRTLAMIDRATKGPKT